MIKSRRMKWAGYVTHMGEKKGMLFRGKATRKETTRKTKTLGRRIILQDNLGRINCLFFFDVEPR
jgi:hypothetical protein